MTMTYHSKTKYHNKPVIYNGERFDSKKELNRWQELKLLERTGRVCDLRRQVKYQLIPAQREPDTIGKNGKPVKGKLLEREVCYIADFDYYLEQPGQKPLHVIEDTKGVRTSDYIIKRKLMLYRYGERIKEL